MGHSKEMSTFLSLDFTEILFTIEIHISILKWHYVIWTIIPPWAINVA